MNKVNLFQHNQWPTWAPNVIAFFGLAIYFVQSIVFAHTTPSNLDEGGYLYKGFLFATRVYRPFQPYGVWTNKAPLSFLIPGYVQLLFGAGLRTGRYLACVEGCLAVFGTWIGARRIGGKWLATMTVWVMAMSPAVIKVYSVGVTQPLIACLLAWALVLSLGEDRPLWQLVLSSILASLMILARQNMVVVLPLLLLYVFWQHGLKKGLWTSFAGIVVFVVGHLIYWPEIMQIWLPWLPYQPALLQGLIPPFGGGQTVWNPLVEIAGRVLSVLQGFRWHFVILVGVLFSILLLPSREKYKDMIFTRMLVFLMLLFGCLLYLHSYASLDQNYCVFCFAPYLSFFSPVGLLIVVLTIKSWNSKPHILLQILILLSILIIAGATGYATFEDTGKWLSNIPVPRIRNGQILMDLTTLGETLGNKFSLEQSGIRKLSAGFAGLFCGIAVILMTFVLYKWKLRYRYSFGFLVANVFLASGFILSPLLAGSQGTPDCSMDVISANEEIGKKLSEILPAGSQVYWDGGLSVVPLLYASQVRIYPPQINGGYNYREGGDTNALLRDGYWNGELAQLWRNQADIIIVEEWRYTAWQSFLAPSRYEELLHTQGTSCEKDSGLRIFKKITK